MLLNLCRVQRFPHHRHVHQFLHRRNYRSCPQPYPTLRPIRRACGHQVSPRIVVFSHFKVILGVREEMVQHLGTVILLQFLRAKMEVIQLHMNEPFDIMCILKSLECRASFCWKH